MSVVSERKELARYPFAVIIRTQGNRRALLAEALHSLAFQTVKCLAVVVVHAESGQVGPVCDLCCQTENLDYAVLHAGETDRKRGYPLNAGLQYCFRKPPDIDALIFLDDDDVLYPFFTLKMQQAFLAKSADLVYAASNRRHPEALPEFGYAPGHPVNLLVENPIPINSYAVRTDRLRESDVLFDEDLDYLEDWYFLLQLLEKGLRLESISEALCEFRIVSDGNSEVKEQPQVWNDASLRIRKYINTTRFSFCGDQLVNNACTLKEAASELRERTVYQEELETKLEEASAEISRRGEYQSDLEKRIEESHEELLRGKIYQEEQEQRILDAETEIGRRNTYQKELEDRVEVLTQEKDLRGTYIDTLEKQGHERGLMIEGLKSGRTELQESVNHLRSVISDLESRLHPFENSLLCRAWTKFKGKMRELPGGKGGGGK